MTRRVLRRRLVAAGLLAATLGAASAAAADAPRVVASVAPVHSLVSAVTGDATAPHLIVPAGQSPHTFSLAPSDARALSRADVVFTAGGATDRFLQRSLRTLAGDARHVALLTAPGVEQLPARSGGAWRPSEGEDHGHAHGETHDHDEGGATAGATSAAIDPHAWLDPRNAIAFIEVVADTLAELDPGGAERYRANAEAAAARLAALDDRLEQKLAPLTDRSYFVFHDAYQYFERHYGLAAAGSVVVDPGRPPGARRLTELRDRIRAEDVACLFVEPQFEPRVAQSIIEGTGVRIGKLDPLGAGLEPGAGLYPELLERLAGALRGCLSGDAAS